ncbi:hypothetical protein Tco_0190106 [Tanacetum coccineum]
MVRISQASLAVFGLATTNRFWRGSEMVVKIHDKMILSTLSSSGVKGTDVLVGVASVGHGPLRHVSRQGASYFITFTYDYSRYGYFEKRLISQEISERAVDLEEIQEEEDTTPSEITSNIPQEVEGFEPPQPPQEEVIPIRRSERTRRAPNRLCLNVEVEEHSLGDLGEPTNYKAAMLDPESKKWVHNCRLD